MTKLSPRLTNWVTGFEVAGSQRQMTSITNEHCAFSAYFFLLHRYFPVVSSCVIKQAGVEGVDVESARHLRKQRS